MGYTYVADNMDLIRLAVVASQICEITRNSPKIRTDSSSRSSDVIALGAYGKHICNFLLVINSNFGRFRDIDAFSSKTACFLSPLLFDAPSGGTPSNINVTYTPLKSTFNGLQLQFCPKSAKSHKMPREFEFIPGQGHQKLSILMSIESAYATSY